jgi:hypothetical protein
MDKLKRVTDGSFYTTLRDYLEARIKELDSQWTGDGSIDSFRQLQGRKLEVEDILKQLTREPIKMQSLDSYGD